MQFKKLELNKLEMPGMYNLYLPQVFLCIETWYMLQCITSRLTCLDSRCCTAREAKQNVTFRYPSQVQKRWLACRYAWRASLSIHTVWNVFARFCTYISKMRSALLHSAFMEREGRNNWSTSWRYSLQHPPGGFRPVGDLLQQMIHKHIPSHHKVKELKRKLLQLLLI